jgi:Fe-S cluster assembly scaffold protein SufB
MSNEYENALAEVSSEIISAAVEYSGEQGIDLIYVYLSTEDLLFADVFYRQHGKIVDTAKLQGVDTSGERQRALMTFVVSQLRSLVDVARDMNMPIPSEMRFRYDVASGGLNSDLRYGDLGLGADESESDLVERWMDSERERR